MNGPTAHVYEGQIKLWAKSTLIPKQLTV
jgi:hypothetical protein